MPVYSIMRDHIVGATVEELWTFITNPNNLEILTPAKFGGKSLDIGKSMPIHEGMISNYSIKLFPLIHVKWTARFSNIRYLDTFTDEQIVGPFKSWKHVHTIIVHRGNVIMRDEITFEPPIPMLGEFVYRNFILNRLHDLFRHRDNMFDTLFPRQTTYTLI